MTKAKKVNLTVLEQGSGHPNPTGSVEVEEMHKVSVDDVLYVYSPGALITLAEAQEHGLAVSKAVSDE